MIAVTGAALGFLPFNFHPAKTFMGDSGSLYLGFMIASISVLGSTKGATLIVTIVPFLALGLPIFDTIFAIIRRWINGTPIMGADKGHVHHRIMNTGIGQRRTVLIMYCISAIMGMVAIMLVRREILESLILTVVGALLLCVFVADHSSLRAIMQEGIPQAADPKKETSSEEAGGKSESQQAASDEKSAGWQEDTARAKDGGPQEEAAVEKDDGSQEETTAEKDGSRPEGAISPKGGAPQENKVSTAEEAGAAEEAENVSEVGELEKPEGEK